MRKLIMSTIAVLALILSQVAFAGGYHRNHHHRDRYIVGGALVGLAIGAAIANSRSDRYDGHRYRYDDRYYRHDHRRNHRGYSSGYGYERPVIRHRDYRYNTRGRYCPDRRYR